MRALPKQTPTIVFIPCAVILFFSLACGAHGAESIFSFTDDGRINATIENIPLNQVLQHLKSRFPFDLKGIPLGNDAVFANLQGTTFEEALKKILRGYNYVLISSGPTQKATIMVLSRAERTKYVEPTPVREPPPPPPHPVSHPTPVAGQGTATLPLGGPPPPAPEAQAIGGGQMAPPGAPGMADSSPTQGGVSGGRVSSFSPAPAFSGGDTASAAPAGYPTPPSPPRIPGLDAPPMPPGTAGTDRTAPPETLTPPALPTQSQQGTSSGTSGSQPSTSTGTGQDLRPPSIPN